MHILNTMHTLKSFVGAIRNRVIEDSKCRCLERNQQVWRVALATAPKPRVEASVKFKKLIIGESRAAAGPNPAQWYIIPARGYKSPGDWSCCISHARSLAPFLIQHKWFLHFDSFYDGISPRSLRWLQIRFRTQQNIDECESFQCETKYFRGEVYS